MHKEGEQMSPIDYLEAMADRMSQGATNIKKIADAAQPLYDSLGRMLMPQRPRFAMMEMMMHRHMGDHDGDE
jgi:hypothetical protein